MPLARARYPALGESDEALLQRHGTLVDRVARRVAARSGHAVSPDDLWSAGALGLLDAARRFDPTRDVRFETFAEHRIRGAMIDELRRMDHLPRRLRAQVERVADVRLRLHQQLGRDPSPDEVASAAGIEPDDVDGLAALSQPLVPVRADLPDPSRAPDERLASAEMAQELAEAVAALPDRLQSLLALHYQEGLTYREIAQVLGVSQPRVCQLHAEAVQQLRRLMSRGA
jgi:RNA polymerase sigma factor for flagellar operon FliA